MRIPEVGITRVSTVNMSESGILLNVLDKPAPPPGEPVYLQLDGIVSNAAVEHKIYAMQVVRSQGSEIGLTFA